MEEATPPDDGLIAADKVAALLDCTRAHVFDLVARKELPPPVLRGNPRFTRWRASDIRAYIADPEGWMRQATASGE